MTQRNPIDLRVVAEKLRQPYEELGLWSEIFADMQQERIRMENRIRSARVENPSLPGRYAIHMDALGKVEHGVDLDLVRCYRRVAPAGVIAWQKAQLGIGEHMLARLLGSLGHPRLAVPHAWVENPDFDDEQPSSRENPKRQLIEDGEPYLRGIGQLWQYCGHGAPERKRKGMSQDDALDLGKPLCKMLVHLMAESCLKAGGYRDLYDETKAKYLAREDFTKGHAHNCALRRMGKEILRDLWLAADADWT